MAQVRIPGTPVDPAATDIGDPLKQLLVDLGLLESAADLQKGVSLREGTPPSLQVIKAGALSVTKAWTGLTATAGFASAATTLGAAWKAASDNLQIALIGGASLILAATAIAIALIVRGDVGARAVTSVELYRARAQVSHSFLASVLAGSRTASSDAEVASESDTLARVLASVEIEVPNEASSPGLYGVRKRPDHDRFEIRRSNGDWVAVRPGTHFEVELPVPRPTG